MEQPKKPGASRDIADLKARLGLLKNPAPAPAATPGAPAASPYPAAAPPAAMGGMTAPAPAGNPLGLPRSVPAPVPMAAPAPAPTHDPFAGMKPSAGRQFDLRAAMDDGQPVESVRARGGKAGLVIGFLLLLVGGGVGYGFGGAAIGRKAFNSANAAARTIKTEVAEMHKTVTQIGTAVAMSQQRLAAEKREALSYDPKLIGDLEKVKLDPRPDTTRIFKADYARLEDLAVDRLMTYYYDTIALYGEVERHIKRTKADQASLEAFAARQGERKDVNYGVVFTQGGKLVLGNLVEIGAQVCKGGAEQCGADQLEGFQARSNTGAPWTPRKVGGKLAGDLLVPLDRTPLLETAMSGSPEQVRFEQYRQRFNNIRLLLARLAAEQKQLMEAIDKAAQREDLFTL